MNAFPSWNWNGEAKISEGKVKQIAMAVSVAPGERSGQLDVIYVGSNDEVHHKRQSGDGSGAWVDLPPLAGSSANEVAKAARLALCNAQDGTLELIYIGTGGSLYRNRQTSPGGTAWGISVPFQGNSAKRIALALDSIGRLELFYVGSDHKLFHNRQQSAGSADWEGEYHFDGITANEVALALNADGFLEAFYTTTADDLYHLLQTSTNDIGDWVGTGLLAEAKAKARELAVAANQDGRLELFYVGMSAELFHNWQTTTADLTSWATETRFPGSSAKHIAVTNNADGRLELFYIGTDNGLYHDWQVRPNGTWIGEVRFIGNEAKQIACALNASDQVELCYVGSNDAFLSNWQVVPNGGWLNQSDQGAMATPPASGLGSASNFVMSNCEFLVDVRVTIEFTQDLIVQESGFPGNSTYPPNLDPSNHGLSWQLNCFSTAGASVVWQQYGLDVSASGHTLSGFVDNWFDPDAERESLNKTFRVAGLPGKIPAGYQAVIALTNDDTGAITGVECRLTDEKGALKGHSSCKLTDHGVKPADLSPIVGFELNLVGEFDLEFAKLSSGAGLICYASSMLLRAEGSVPACAATATPTGETANSLYGPMLDMPSTFLFHDFDVAAMDAAIIRRPGRAHGRPRAA